MARRKSTKTKVMTVIEDSVKMAHKTQNIIQNFTQMREHGLFSLLCMMYLHDGTPNIFTRDKLPCGLNTPRPQQQQYFFKENIECYTAYNTAIFGLTDDRGIIGYTEQETFRDKSIIADMYGVPNSVFLLNTLRKTYQNKGNAGNIDISAYTEDVDFSLKQLKHFSSKRPSINLEGEEIGVLDYSCVQREMTALTGNPYNMSVPLEVISTIQHVNTRSVCFEDTNTQLYIRKEIPSFHARADIHVYILDNFIYTTTTTLPSDLFFPEHIDYKLSIPCVDIIKEIALQAITQCSNSSTNNTYWQNGSIYNYTHMFDTVQDVSNSMYDDNVTEMPPPPTFTRENSHLIIPLHDTHYPFITPPSAYNHTRYRVILHSFKSVLIESGLQSNLDMLHNVGIGEIIPLAEVILDGETNSPALLPLTMDNFKPIPLTELGIEEVLKINKKSLKTVLQGDLNSHTLDSIISQEVIRTVNVLRSLFEELYNLEIESLPFNKEESIEENSKNQNLTETSTQTSTFYKCPTDIKCPNTNFII